MNFRRFSIRTDPWPKCSTSASPEKIERRWSPRSSVTAFPAKRWSAALRNEPGIAVAASLWQSRQAISHAFGQLRCSPPSSSAAPASRRRNPTSLTQGKAMTRRVSHPPVPLWPRRSRGQWRAPRQVAAAWPTRISARSVSGRSTAPVEAAKTISPSKGVWLGTTARAIPSWAMTARRLACALLSARSVATIATTVAPRASGLVRTSSRGAIAGPSPPNSAPSSNAGCPELPGLTSDHGPYRVRRHQRAHRDPVDHRRGRAQPALHIRAGGARAGPD